MFSECDYQFMAKAIKLAETPVFSPHPNPRVGCVIVTFHKENGQIVGEGFHEFAGGPHAEVNALNDAAERKMDVMGATAYVTLEPCSHHGKTPPCADTLIRAGITRIVIAMLDPNPLVAGTGKAKLENAGIRVDSGLLKAEAESLNKGFIKRMKFGLPWVRSKIAMSLDGRTAMASGESQWITGSEARKDVQRLRVKSDAILTGSGTVLADDPKMTVRDIEELAAESTETMRQPLRVIVDRQLKTRATAAILNQPGDSWIATTQARKQANGESEKFSEKVTVKTYREKASHVDLAELLADLAANQINEVHVEAGAVLNGVLLDEKLIDELVVYMAPTVMGDSARGLFHLPQLQEMSERFHFSTNDVRCVGNDIRLSLTPRYSDK